MRYSIITILLLLVSLSACSQDPFSADAVSPGTTVIRFSGTRVETDLDGTLEMAGTLTLGDQQVAFTTSGLSYGYGVGDTSTLAVTLWALFETEGVVGEEAMPLTLRGGMHVLGEEADLTTLSLGAGEGVFFAIAEIADSAIWISGTLIATASGTFVPAEDPTTMQIEAIGTFAMTGVQSEPADDMISQLPWTPEDWPEKQYEDLLSLLFSVNENEAAD